MKVAQLRIEYHSQIVNEVLTLVPTSKSLTGLCPNFSDKDNESSVKIGNKLVELIGCEIGEKPRIKGQTAGKRFELATRQFLRNCFELLQHLRPGDWSYEINRNIGFYEQYAHLVELKNAIQGNSELRAALGGDYLVEPDILIGRKPLSDQEINRNEQLIDDVNQVVLHSPLRASTAGGRARSEAPYILHASISCKWSLRSDRAQNARTEALNLIRNRKGNQPHIVTVTAEPLPTRLAALALGTGDLDCVYHFALTELEASISELKLVDQKDMLQILVAGKRLRDISDLPFDLAI
jgi:hypothetical protein